MNTLPSIEDIIQYYNLSPHIEGGYYYRTYVSDIKIEADSLPQRFSNGERSLSSTILYLVPGNVKSAIHRLCSDEIWHFYMGAPFKLIEISEGGDFSSTVLGTNINNKEQVQCTICHGSWFGGYVLSASGYSLMGCTISPGFNEQDFELASREYLLERHSQHSDCIRSGDDNINL